MRHSVAAAATTTTDDRVETNSGIATVAAATDDDNILQFGFSSSPFFPYASWMHPFAFIPTANAFFAMQFTFHFFLMVCTHVKFTIYVPTSFFLVFAVDKYRNVYVMCIVGYWQTSFRFVLRSLANAHHGVSAFGWPRRAFDVLSIQTLQWTQKKRFSTQIRIYIIMASSGGKKNVSGKWMRVSWRDDYEQYEKSGNFYQK